MGDRLGASRTMTAMKFCVFLTAALIGGMPSYGWAAPAMSSAAIDGASVQPVQNRLEMRSFQPYAGLQDDTVPVDPPIQRGVPRTRPQIPMPTAVNPVIDQGVPNPYTAQWYTYCSRRYRSFEPGTGLYTTFSGQRRPCR